MSKIKISAVSYLNSTPFIYGLEHSDIIRDIELSRDIPAVCAEKTLNGTVDIGLVPVAILPAMKEVHILTDHCIGAVGNVGSVMLYSQVELKDIKEVLLDHQSRTSVALARILSKHYWKIAPAFTPATADFETKISGSTAAVIIGDRTFDLSARYKYVYDLSGEWQKFTCLPFVFACWVANKELPAAFKERFREAIRLGVENRPALIKELKADGKFDIDVENYLLKSISYSFDQPKKEALKLFLTYLSDME